MKLGFNDFCIVKYVFLILTLLGQNLFIFFLLLFLNSNNVFLLLHRNSPRVIQVFC